MLWQRINGRFRYTKDTFCNRHSRNSSSSTVSNESEQRNMSIGKFYNNVKIPWWYSLHHMYFYISVSSFEQSSSLLWIFWPNLCWFQDTIFVFLRYADCATTSHFQYQIVFIRAAKYWPLFVHGRCRWIPLRYYCCIINTEVADNTFLSFRLFFLLAAASKSMLPTITLEAPQCLRCLGTKWAITGMTLTKNCTSKNGLKLMTTGWNEYMIKNLDNFSSFWKWQKYNFSFFRFQLLRNQDQLHKLMNSIN